MAENMAIQEMKLKILAGLIFLCVNYMAYYELATEMEIPDRESFESFPTLLSGWQCDPSEMGEQTELNLGVTDYLLCNWAHRETGEVANLYVGYHETQIRLEGGGAGENAIHPPKHCLPGSGWNIIAQSIRELDIDGLAVRPAEVNRLVIAKGNQRQLVYYWYQSRGRVIAKDWEKIVALTWDRGVRSRTDGSLIRFTIPMGRSGEHDAEETFSRLASAVMPNFPRHIPN